MRSISASVGANGRNLKADVITIQELLNKVPLGEGGPQAPLKVDGLCWDKTVAAIRRFQSVKLGHKWPDGRVDPGGKTLARLNEYDRGDAPGPRLSYLVPGYKVTVGQKGWNTCWAAVYAMLRSWRESKTFAIEEALEKPGQPYIGMFQAGLPLPPSRFRDFWTRCGLTVRGNAYFPHHIWYDLLRRHGLLAVGSANGLPATGLHLRVVEGMSVTSSPGDRYLIMDPAWGGMKYPEPAFDFEARYNLAMTMGFGAHWQVAHYY